MWMWLPQTRQGRGAGRDGYLFVFALLGEVDRHYATKSSRELYRTSSSNTQRLLNANEDTYKITRNFLVIVILQLRHGWVQTQRLKCICAGHKRNRGSTRLCPWEGPREANYIHSFIHTYKYGSLVSLLQLLHDSLYKPGPKKEKGHKELVQKQHPQH